MDNRNVEAEKWMFLLAIAAFLCLSLVFLGSALAVTQERTRMIWRVGCGVGCFVFAVFLFLISPSNQGRTIRDFLPWLPKPIRAADIETLQRTVGSAGFFNRIGLTGIPLAVALLACVLYGLVFLAHRLAPDAQSAFLDMAKLTTGAFIGALSTSRKGPPTGNVRNAKSAADSVENPPL